MEPTSSTSLNPVSDEEKLKRMSLSEVPELECLLEYHKAQTQAAAELGLKLYNKKDQHIKYTLDKALNSNGFYFNCEFCGDIIHVNFTAKKECEFDSGPSSNMFFAEIYCGLDEQMEVLSCVIVDPKETDGEKISNHCNYCSDKFELPIYHAVEHCQYGKYDEDHYYYVNYDSDDVYDEFGVI